MNPLRFVTTPVLYACLATSPCYATDYLTIEQAQKLMFPSAVEFEVAHTVFTNQQKIQIEASTGLSVMNRAQKIWRAHGEKDEFIGWFVVDYVVGKHMLIDYAIAIDANRTVKEVEILSYRESYGGEIRSENWLHQFDGKSKDSAVTLNRDITNIGGATLSSRHVTEGVKRVLATINVTQ